MDQVLKFIGYGMAFVMGIVGAIGWDRLVRRAGWKIGAHRRHCNDNGPAPNGRPPIPPAPPRPVPGRPFWDEPPLPDLAFRREQRYIVLKLTDVARAHLTAEERVALNALCSRIAAARHASGRPRLGAVVVEADWPEYAIVWRAIEARTRRDAVR